MKTWRDHASASGSYSEYISLRCWARPIRELDPLYVYHHRLNIVVVQKREGNREEGVYIPNLLSSSGSVAPGHPVEGFILEKDDSGKGCHPFRRERPTNHAIQADAPASRR